MNQSGYQKETDVNLPKGLICKKLNEGTICGGVVRIKGINNG